LQVFRPLGAGRSARYEVVIWLVGDFNVVYIGFTILTGIGKIGAHTQ
jgi:hypothetical protein